MSVLLYHYDVACSDCLLGFSCEHCINADYVTCDHCHGVVPVMGADRIGDDLLCWHCQQSLHACDRCGSVAADLTSVASGDSVCQDCIDRYYSWCEHCEEYTDDTFHYVRTDQGRHDQQIWCESCVHHRAYACSDCGELCYDGGVGLSQGGQVICTNCAENYSTCYECDRIIYTGDGDYEIIDDEVLCLDCANSRTSKSIHPYSYKPEPIFFGHTEAYLGVELETAEYDNGPERFFDFMDLPAEIYAKEDGSLTRGVEFVTHPCSLAYHANAMPWDKLFVNVKRAGGLGHDAGKGVGLHVHVSRRALTSDQWARVCQFLAYNIVFFERIARRSNAYYSKDLDYENPCKVMEQGHDRYYWLNFQNRNTVEFRGFRSTLKYSTFFGILELCHACVAYIGQLKDSDIFPCSWSSFMRWTHGQEIYGNLNSFYGNN